MRKNKSPIVLGYWASAVWARGSLGEIKARVNFSRGHIPNSVPTVSNQKLLCVVCLLFWLVKCLA